MFRIHLPMCVCSVVPTDELWIGLNDQRTQNLFEWSDRTHVTFTKWTAGEPSHIISRMEDCVLIKGKVGRVCFYYCCFVHYPMEAYFHN